MEQHICSYHDTYQETLNSPVLCGICHRELGEVELLRYKLEIAESRLNYYQLEVGNLKAKLTNRNRQIRDLRRALRK